MTASITSVILNKEIRRLDLSDGFKELSKLMGFDTLQQIIAIGPAELFKKEKFDYAWFGELIKYLDKNGLGNLLQPLPGKNHG